MIDLWGIFRYILYFFFRVILWKNAIVEDSDTQTLTDNSLEHLNRKTQLQPLKNLQNFKETFEAIPCNNKLKRREKRKQDLQSEDTKNIRKLDPTEGTEMSKNYARRNSKRFVIGDGEDDFDTISQLPDVTVTEPPEGHSQNWALPNSSSRLSIRSTLT